MAHGASRTCLEKDDVIATVIAECVQCVYKNLNLTEWQTHWHRWWPAWSSQPNKSDFPSCASVCLSADDDERAAYCSFL